MSKRPYVVILTLFVDETECSPIDEWSWPDLLDMDYEDVILEDVIEG